MVICHAVHYSAEHFRCPLLSYLAQQQEQKRSSMVLVNMVIKSDESSPRSMTRTFGCWSKQSKSSASSAIDGKISNTAVVRKSSSWR